MSPKFTLSTGSSTADRLARELMDKAVHLTTENIRRYIRGIPLKARMALRAGIHLPHGSLTIRMPDKQVFKVGGNKPGPDAVRHPAQLEPSETRPDRVHRRCRRKLHGRRLGKPRRHDLPRTVPRQCRGLAYQVANANRIFNAFNGLRHWLNRNTRIRARKNISAHYDLGNAFYSRGSIRAMTYSSALFSEGANDLESAQTAKYRALAQGDGNWPR